MSCSGTRLCCHLCLNGDHKGHDLIPIDEAARSAREDLVRAAYAVTNGISTPVPVVVTPIAEIPAAVKHAPVVLAAQGGALAVTDEIAGLQRSASAAQVSIDEMMCALEAALREFRADVTSQLAASVNVQGGILQTRQAAWDSLHDRATATTSAALQATIVLGPSNAAMHSPSLVRGLASLRAEIEAQAQAPPQAPAYVGIAAAAALRIRELVQAVRDAAKGAVTDIDDGGSTQRATAKQYNHAPAPAGAVYDAAEAGDVPALMRALEGGASTEETGGAVRAFRRG
jgi:hypothetical protein